MKKILIVLLSIVMITSGCSSKARNSSNLHSSSSEKVNNSKNTKKASDAKSNIPADVIGDDTDYSYESKFKKLNDQHLISYVKDSVYENTVNDLDSADYFVDNVDAVYVSDDYLEEAQYNSKSNIFFGYTLDEIEKVYPNTQYVFTLGKNGNTVVKPFENYDDTYEKIIKNVAVGTGVILVCVTVSVVTCGAGAPAVSMIFATSAKTGTAIALSSGTISAVATGIVTGVQTGDMKKAMKAAAVSGSESFKWGAISGAAAGGASEALALKGATLNGLSINDAASIQKESGYPLDVIKQFKSMDEYQIYKNAGLKAQMVNGKVALVQNIDWNQKITLPNGQQVTNQWLVENGYSPYNANGVKYELHHVNQEADGTLAVLDSESHRGKEAYKILHRVGKEGVHNPESGIPDVVWNKQKHEFWMDLLNQYLKASI